jgi:thiol-disulfide isomerase/thioredoxin
LRLALACALLVLACKSSKGEVAPIGTSAPLSLGPPTFSFDSLDARPVTSDAMRGKTSVLVFITTWDVASQAEVTFLVKMAEHDGGSVNYAIVALQEPEARELVEQYARVMKVTFPVAMGDTAMLTTAGPLGDVGKVPTVVILDDTGRVVYRSSGVINSGELRAHMPK